MKSLNISVIGAGSWGTALSILLARNGHHVNLWGHNKREVEKLRKDRENKKYLPSRKRYAVPRHKPKEQRIFICYGVA